MRKISNNKNLSIDVDEEVDVKLMVMVSDDGVTFVAGLDCYYTINIEDDLDKVKKDVISGYNKMGWPFVKIYSVYVDMEHFNRIKNQNR